MSVQDLWWKTDKATGKKVKTSRHGCPKRWRVNVSDYPQLGFEKKTDADAHDVYLRGQLVQGITPAVVKRGKTKSITFEQVAIEWLEANYTNPRSRRAVESRLNHMVYPKMRNWRVGNIDSGRVTEWWTWLGKAKKRGGKEPYAEKTRYYAWTHVGSILKYAAQPERGYIAQHPYRSMDAPTEPVTAPLRAVWETDHVHGVVGKLPERYRAIGTVSAQCGHRPGESFAVALEDLDHDRGEIHVRHQVQREGGRLVLVPPKRGRTRVTPMATATGLTLQAHADRYGTLEATCECCPGKVWRLIFTTEDGQMISQRDFTREAWNPAVSAALPAELVEATGAGQHWLRHFYASMLIDGGALPTQVRDYMGHRSTAMVEKVYGHLFKRRHDSARAMVNALFQPHLYTVCTEDAA